MRTIILTLICSCPLLAESIQQWHKHTLDFQGPETAETAEPNPFTDYRLDVTFSQGELTMSIPGYYAADGKSAQSSKNSGKFWRVHFSPPTTGDWNWKARFLKGEEIAMADNPTRGHSAGFFDGETGTFTVTASDKKLPDFRAKGLLKYAGDRYPRTQGDQKIFLKVGVDAPENLLSYADFDGDFKSDGIADHLVKTWQPHFQDWKEGDPTWGDDKGKGLIGAVNYLSAQGLNSLSFLTMNIGGDDKNVFPYLNHKDHTRFDVSRLAQWEIVFEHATSKGMFLHFKTQESENETLLDEGDLGPLRKLYYRELIARFSHHPALNWNMGEENGKWKSTKHHKPLLQSTAQRLAMGRYFEKNDPYQHPLVIHNGQWFDDLYGPDSPYNGASLQTANEEFKWVHRSTLKILNASAKAGKQWMVACDEPGDAQRSLVPDDVDPTHDLPRMNALWGNILAGGWGVEWYFGYRFPHSDLSCQDYRVRENMWKQCRVALEFFEKNSLPLAQMQNHNKLLHGEGFCLATPGETYLLLVKNPMENPRLDLSKQEGEFEIHWYNPRAGGELKKGGRIRGGSPAGLGTPPTKAQKDWVALIRKS